MESDEDDEETQASFCRFLDDNFKLPISAYAPDCVPKVEIKERLNIYFNGITPKIMLNFSLYELNDFSPPSLKKSVSHRSKS